MNEGYIKLIRSFVVILAVLNVVTGVVLRPDQIQGYLLPWGVSNTVLLWSCGYATVILVVQAYLIRHIMNAHEIANQIYIRRNVWWTNWINKTIEGVFFNSETRNGRLKDGYSVQYRKSETRWKAALLKPVNGGIWILNKIIIATIVAVARKRFLRSFPLLVILGALPGVTIVAVYLVTMKRFWWGLIPIFVGEYLRVIGLYTWGLSAAKWLLTLVGV